MNYRTHRCLELAVAANMFFLLMLISTYLQVPEGGSHSIDTTDTVLFSNKSVITMPVQSGSTIMSCI